MAVLLGSLRATSVDICACARARIATITGITGIARATSVDIFAERAARIAAVPQIAAAPVCAPTPNPLGPPPGMVASLASRELPAWAVSHTSPALPRASWILPFSSSVRAKTLYRGTTLHDQIFLRQVNKMTFHLKSSASSFFIGFLSSPKINYLPKKILGKGQMLTLCNFAFHKRTKYGNKKRSLVRFISWTDSKNKTLFADSKPWLKHE